MVSKLVEEQVAEAMGGPDAIFQPFFQTHKIHAEIKRRQTVVEQNKFIYCFAKWGCMVCGTQERPHGAVGMCYPCYRRIAERLKAVVREGNAGKQDTFFDSGTLARAALHSQPLIVVANPEQGQSGRLYTNREAVAAVGIHRETLYAWIKAGDAKPSIRMTPKKSLWTEEDVERLKILKRKNASQHNSKAARGRWAKQKEASR
jgi:predicted DNA-binding transcriptional regulator AlpA